jgi:ubiquinone biosynthesis protein Coq4
MDINVFSREQLDVVFQVLRTAVSPAPTLLAPEQALLDTYAAITGYALPAGGPRPTRAGDVRMEGAHERKRLVQLAAVAAMLSNPVRAASVDFVAALDRALGVGEPVVPVLRALSRGARGRARLLTARRGLTAMLRESYTAEGAWGVLRFAGALLLRARVNADKLSKYKRLGLLPEGTLGREYWKHLTALGFNFPGEPEGIPDSVAYHDIAHVLANHDTSPAGEMQQGSFQAGNRRDDGFFFLQFVLLQFHHGIKISPPVDPEVGHFDPARVLWAIERGARCNVDLTHQWDYWPLMSLPLDEVRARCQIEPAVAAA